MTQRGPFVFLVIMLVLAGLTSAIYRHDRFNIPFLPGTQETVWQVEAKINFWGDGAPVQAILSLPSNQPDYPHRQRKHRLVRLRLRHRGKRRPTPRALVEARRSRRTNAVLQSRTGRRPEPIDAARKHRPDVAPVRLDEPYATAAQTLVNAVLPRSADALTLGQQLIREMTTVPRDQNVALLLDRFALPRCSAICSRWRTFRRDASRR